MLLNLQVITHPPPRELRVGSLLGGKTDSALQCLGGEPGMSSQKSTLVVFVIHVCYVPVILHLHTEPREMLTGILKMLLAMIFVGQEQR